MQTQNHGELIHLAKHLMDLNSDSETIEKKLLEKTSDVELVTALVNQVKREHYASKRKSGLQKMGIGLALMLVGFCITCLNFHSNKSFTFVMYGFTASGLVLLLWGLYDLVG